jgi:hypothetical protein
MKTLVLALFVFTLSLTVSAQHTLAFNRSMLLVSGNSYTVPANTTWKVESVFFNNYCTDLFYSSASYLPTFSITPPGGSATTVYYMGQGYSGYNPTNGNTLPSWLPEGTVISATGATSMISVVEFVIQ